MTTEVMLEMAMERWDGERRGYLCRTDEARRKIDGDYCHDVALTYHIEPDELADYIGRQTGSRPDPWYGQPAPSEASREESG